MEYQIIDIPKITDPRGNLAVVEGDTIPFEIKRIYYLFDVPSDSHRGGHAHKSCRSLLIPLSGSFTVKLYDGKEWKSILLNKPDKGLLIPTMLWRELEDFSSGAVCLSVASHDFDESDYIREIEAFELASRS
ncbi:WxcM-like, C-terminal [Nonlabens sp. Hel1_33_55]|uniref:sugar 3,4-ketoisomerase n=1 Tax=Nonlabens sp. Hel1_33_55 TaxID=1336802 RepID=UPI000875BD8E|nr:FdtA/QdtA family cupin domain-containing protein [Nonlabens sp. Hel1_33_55]SCX87243.1 WxcM-like, C-terminal [Nonlabens sp. Hel1_33_55]